MAALISRVNLTLCPYARARARGDVELGDETDPLEPALRLLGDVADSILVIPDRGDAEGFSVRSAVTQNVIAARFDLRNNVRIKTCNLAVQQDRCGQL